MVQQICQQLRSPEELSDEAAMDFEEITAAQPWIDFAGDIGVSLDENQAFEPRIFKSHQPLSSINRGCKYISTVRSPEATARSYYYFYKAKNHPSVRDLSLDEWVLKWAREGTWSPPIFEHYVELAKCRQVLSVLLLVYEDVVASPREAVCAIAEHILTTPVSDSHIDTVVRRASKSFMGSYVDKFDDHFLEQEQRRRGCANVLSSSAKVVGDNVKRAQISDSTRHALDAHWKARVLPHTGFASYEEMCGAIRTARRK